MNWITVSFACTESYIATFVRSDGYGNVDGANIAVHGISELECEIKCLEEINVS